MRHQTINCCGCNNVKHRSFNFDQTSLYNRFSSPHLQSNCTPGVIRRYTMSMSSGNQKAISKVLNIFGEVHNGTPVCRFQIWKHTSYSSGHKKERKKKPNGDTYDNKPLSASSLLWWMLMKHKSVSYCLSMYTAIIHLKGGHPKMLIFLVHVHP
jgi:hypothetical protein